MSHPTFNSGSVPVHTTYTPIENTTMALYHEYNRLDRLYWDRPLSDFTSKSPETMAYLKSLKMQMTSLYCEIDDRGFWLYTQDGA